MRKKPILLSKTNPTWNNCKFNSQQVIGSTMGILKAHTVKSEAEYINLYYELGEIRDKIIAEKFSDFPINLNDPNEIRQAVLTNHTILNDVFDLNNNYGRTREFIENVAKDFAEEAKIDYDLALRQVEHRIFTESFKGEGIENLCLEYFKKDNPNLCFRKATQAEDGRYATDIICERDGKIVLGIQVKPFSYLLKEDFQHKENERKNLKFENDTNAKVIYYYYFTSDKSDRPYGFVTGKLSHVDEELLSIAGAK